MKSTETDDLNKILDEILNTPRGPLALTVKEWFRIYLGKPWYRRAVKEVYRGMGKDFGNMFYKQTYLNFPAALSAGFSFHESKYADVFATIYKYHFRSRKRIRPNWPTWYEIVWFLTKWMKK